MDHLCFHFQTILYTIQTPSLWSFYTQQEQEWITTFTSFPIATQGLYLRCFQRQPQWFLVPKLQKKYELEMDALQNSLTVLEKAHFITVLETQKDALIALQDWNRKEMNQVAEALAYGKRKGKARGKREEYEAFCLWIRQQKCIDGSSLPVKKTVT